MIDPAEYWSELGWKALNGTSTVQIGVGGFVVPSHRPWKSEDKPLLYCPPDIMSDHKLKVYERWENCCGGMISQEYVKTAVWSHWIHGIIAKNRYLHIGQYGQGWFIASDRAARPKEEEKSEVSLVPSKEETANGENERQEQEEE